MIDKTKLQELIQLGFSQHKIARLYGVRLSTVQYWLKKYGLRTIYQRYKPIHKPKVSMPIYDQSLEGKTVMHIDFTTVSFKPKRLKKSRHNGYWILTVVITRDSLVLDRLAFITRVKAKDIVMRIIPHVIKAYNVDLCLADKEFAYLNEIIPTYKSAKWNCARQYNEKVHGGLKAQIYPYLMFVKDVLGLSDDDLKENIKLVLRVYKVYLQRNNWKIFDMTSSDTPKLTYSVILTKADRKH